MKIKIKKYRLVFLIATLLVVIILLFYKMIYLTTTKRVFLSQQSKMRNIRTITEPALRGMILDDLSNPIAISTVVYDINMNPRVFYASSEEKNILVNLLGKTKWWIEEKLKENKGKNFVFLKRSVSPFIANQILKLGLDGINISQNFKRYYPEGELFSNVIGFTNIDNIGVEGIELIKNKDLESTAGKTSVIIDRRGNTVKKLVREQAPVCGKNISITLNKNIQYYAYKHLKNSVIHNSADSGTVVVLNIKNGNIVAMANYPSYNPNKFPRNVNDNFKNISITDNFEPGSIMKPFAIAYMINSGKFNVNMEINTHPGEIKIGSHTIKDIRDFGKISVGDVLVKSSNVGMTKMIQNFNAFEYLNFLKQNGFGEKTNINLTGESSGVLLNDEYNNPHTLAVLSFGYSLSVTALQILKSFCIFANGGYSQNITIYKDNNSNENILGKKILSEDIANIMKDLLEKTVSQGSAWRASIEGYRVAGKTGTSRMAKYGYENEKYHSSFIGFAPVSDPVLITIVVVNNPKNGDYYGGLVAAPIFSKVMKDSLERLGIPRDKK